VTEDVEPKPHLATTAGGLGVVIREFTAAIDAGEVSNPVLGHTHLLYLIQAEAWMRRELEEEP